MKFLKIDQSDKISNKSSHCMTSRFTNGSDLVPVGIIYYIPSDRQIVINPHSHPNGFYWSHQCSLTLTPANSMQVSSSKSYISNQAQGKV